MVQDRKNSQVLAICQVILLKLCAGRGAFLVCTFEICCRIQSSNSCTGREFSLGHAGKLRGDIISSVLINITTRVHKSAQHGRTYQQGTDENVAVAWGWGGNPFSSFFLHTSNVQCSHLVPLLSSSPLYILTAISILFSSFPSNPLIHEVFFTL